MSLAGKCAVVYSGARGIGRAYCEHLLKNGCKVYFGDILVEEGSQTALELGRKYKDSTVVFLKCNVLVETEVKELLTRAITDCENVDIVVANTGTVNEIDWEKCMQTNLGSVMRVFYITMEHMSKTNGGKGGDFIITSSVAGLPYRHYKWNITLENGNDFLFLESYTLGFLNLNMPDTASFYIALNMNFTCINPQWDKTRMGVPVYTATKHAITGFVRAWGTEFNYKLTNTRINCICPSGVGTKLLFGLKPEQFFLKEHNEHVVEWKHKTDQLLSSDDIGESLIALLLDTEANGQCLRVEKDGRFYAKFSEEVM